MDSYWVGLLWGFVGIVSITMLFVVFLMWHTNVMDTRRQGGLMIGKIGFAASKIRKTGEVEVDGEYWRAFSEDSINLVKGEKVVIVRVEGLRLCVRRVDDISLRNDRDE